MIIIIFLLLGLLFFGVIQLWPTAEPTSSPLNPQLPNPQPLSPTLNPQPRQ